MSEKHLSTGSKQPPKVEGKLRLYSMKYCPYAQRARLVLKAKNLTHDIVNINLINKPEWYFKIHPEGKVPALDTGSEIIVESTDICDYLDENYPDLYPLYPSDTIAKQKDKELIKNIAPLTATFYKCISGQEQKSPEEWMKEFLPHIEVFENELSKRGTEFFGGDKPGMVDFMLWPWGERAGTISLTLGQKLPFGDKQLLLIREWRKKMRQISIVDEIYTGPEIFWKVVQIKLKNMPPNYDAIN